jgi:hypothetical protein
MRLENEQRNFTTAERRERIRGRDGQRPSVKGVKKKPEIAHVIMGHLSGSSTTASFIRQIHFLYQCRALQPYLRFISHRRSSRHDQSKQSWFGHPSRRRRVGVTREPSKSQHESGTEVSVLTGLVGRRAPVRAEPERELGKVTVYLRGVSGNDKIGSSGCAMVEKRIDTQNPLPYVPLLYFMGMCSTNDERG